MQRFYAGIGSRATPADIIHLMRRFGAIAAMDGYRLNTGGAEGADQAFEAGARISLPAIHMLDVNEECYDTPFISVFLPWVGFCGYKALTSEVLCLDHAGTPELVSQYHPKASKLKPAVISLMRRNCHQVLGRDLATRVNFVVCWTPDGAATAAQTSYGTGGTGFAIRLADAVGIPVFNLCNDAHYERIAKWVDTREAAWRNDGVEFSFTQS